MTKGPGATGDWYIDIQGWKQNIDANWLVAEELNGVFEKSVIKTRACLRSCMGA